MVELPGEDHVLIGGEVEPLVDEIEEFLTGTRPEHPPERVLSTVLFTDIVGSTERAAELGDRRWRELLDRHDRITVHIGARVAARAGPGEVLVSSTVKDLVVGSGLGFVERGAQTLKGVPGEWRLFSLA